LEDRLVPSQVFADLAAFNGVNGRYPFGGVLLDASGNLFGTTTDGGDYRAGTIFEWNKANGTLATLASFNRANGDFPNGSLVEDASGNLFGTSNTGGAHHGGTLFEWNKATGAITVLAAFSGIYGSRPSGGLVEDANGNLFGTTGTGGAHGNGTIFEWLASSHTLKILASLTSATGKWAAELHLDGNGNLFGTTSQGGAAGNGTIFEWTQTTGTLSALASFNASEGQYHYGALVEDQGGNLFGTCYVVDGGPGSIFELPSGSSTITDIALFDGSNNAYPYGGLIIDHDGNLFGTTMEGGPIGAGSIFEWVKSTGTLTDLALFNGYNGFEPETGLAEDGNGNLYGTTAQSGKLGYGDGMVFEWDATSGSIVHLGSFDGPQGGGPSGGVIEDGSGNIYGIVSGGSQGDGAIYEYVQSSGTLNLLASFNGTNGSFPDGSFPGGALLRDANGNLFGTTDSGGSAGRGTVFEWVQSTGTIDVLASFDGSDGASPNGSLVADADGNLYGTTAEGGDQGEGTLFEWVESTGTITVLASFSGPNGAYPVAGVIADADGNLFGTTTEGGTADDGTLYEWVKNTASITVLTSFTGVNGQNPTGELIQDGNGNLFGTAKGTDAVQAVNKYGTLFEWVKSSGTLAVLAVFDGTRAAHPTGTLAEDATGNLFGTTSDGGAYNTGTVFEWIKSNGKIKILTVFNGRNGQFPEAGLILDAHGNLVGTTETGGGRSVSGTLFEIANVTLQPAALPVGTVGSSYGPVTLHATGGSGTYAFSLAKRNKLPPGLTLSPAGVLSGTPARKGRFSFVVVARDATNPSFIGTLKYSITVT
jgi:uncharacterized repeat protein (TIGR03803 family)